MTSSAASVAPTTQARTIDRGPSPAPVNPPVNDSMVDYGSVDTLRGAELVRALGSLTATGHVERRYTEASDALFGSVDAIRGARAVSDIYTRSAKAGVHDRPSAWEQRLSVEHVWPRSKGATGIAEADLHHLFSADKEANGARSSHPFGEATSTSWSTPRSAPGSSRLGSARDGTTVFEPDTAGRGDIARALLYFATRYGTTDHSTRMDNFARELPVLVRWHRDDPVTDAERARNDAVAAFQGNRNPYVDRPELVDRVGVEGFRSLLTRA